jgi:hypothetical protein
MDKNITKEVIPATAEELLFIKKKMPKGVVKMVMIRTGKTRSQVLYQLVQMPSNQDLEIITAFREILYVITGLSFESKK